jgi:hypothetical protein
VHYAAVGGPNQVVSCVSKPQLGSPRTNIFDADQLDPIRPRRDVEAAGMTEVEEHGPGTVQQGGYPQRSARGHQVEIGHAAPEQWMSLAEVVVNVQARQPGPASIPDSPHPAHQSECPVHRRRARASPGRVRGRRQDQHENIGSQKGRLLDGDVGACRWHRKRSEDERKSRHVSYNGSPLTREANTTSLPIRTNEI